ncbi:hypothetical protein [Streptococcus pneumoniae]|uniref:hypothetical protein n=1 Tax=Streptococcus pneumoniae TaxID=1313 RepID=UPI00329820FA
MYVMSVLWQINHIDQLAVEVGKVMANRVYDELISKTNTDCFDLSTYTLLSVIKLSRIINE